MRPPRIALIAVALALGSLPLSADTYPRQPAIDALHYRFAIAVSDRTPRIEGEAVVTLRLVAATPAVELDLTSASGDKGMAVSGVTQAGHAVQFSHTSNRLRLPVPDTAKPGDELSYTIGYAGVPINGLRLLDNIHAEPTIFSENWPNQARDWLPMIDHPYDKATGELLVTAPAQYQVVSNGLLIEETDLGNGQRLTHWKQSVPVASWLYALGMARFDVHHAGRVQGVPLQTWVFPQDRAAGRTVFEETSRRAMDFFSEKVGPYPYEKLANIQAAGLGGGTEHATAIFYGEKGVAAGRAPVVHEIAHQWFGNSVTERDWDDVWLSEGFATYFTLLYTEQFEGRDAFVQGLRRSRQTVLQLEQKLPDTPVIHRNLDDMRRVLNQFVYQKGGWVLHMLRQQIGVDAFWTGIGEYYRRYRDRNASTDDLRQVMEQVSGQDLRWFFTQWLTRSGVPRLDGQWRYDASRKTADITVVQTTAGAPFRIPVEVAIFVRGEDAPRTARLELTEARGSVSVEVPSAPINVTLDPQTILLADLAGLRQSQ